MGLTSSSKNEKEKLYVQKIIINNNSILLNEPKYYHAENFFRNKKISLMRLYFIGESAESVVYTLFSNFLPNDKNIRNIEKNGIEYKRLELQNLKWIIYIINEKISDGICSLIIYKMKNHIKKDNNFCYDAFVPIINDISDTQAKTMIQSIETINIQKNQPFILFLTKKDDNPIRKNFQKLIKNNLFDERNINVSSYKINQSDDNNKIYLIIENMFSKIWGIYSYYNSLGDYTLIPEREIIITKELFPYKLNILVCGKSGLGKSTFINLVLNEKRAKEGEGISLSSKIIRYSHSYYPIAFYDTPGINSPESAKKLINKLELYNIKLKEAKKRIHLLIWFFDFKKRTDIEQESKILNKLPEFNAEILFLINNVNVSIESIEYSNFVVVFIEVIKETKIGKALPNLEKRIIPVNLIPQTENGNIKLPAFGLDTLFYKIHSIFQNYIPKNISSMGENRLKFKKMISQNKLLVDILNKENLKIYLKIEASRIVLNKSREIFFSIFRESKREDMIKQIIHLYFGEDSKKILDYNDFKNNFIKDSFEAEIKVKGEKFISSLFFDDIKNINNEYEFDLDYNVYFYNEYTICIGYLCINYLETLLNENVESFEKSIKNACSSYQKAIFAIKDIGDYFKKEYQN